VYYSALSRCEFGTGGKGRRGRTCLSAGPFGGTEWRVTTTSPADSRGASMAVGAGISLDLASGFFAGCGDFFTAVHPSKIVALAAPNRQWQQEFVD
jgi:hypothetical protein